MAKKKEEPGTLPTREQKLEAVKVLVVETEIENTGMYQLAPVHNETIKDIIKLDTYEPKKLDKEKPFCSVPKSTLDKMEKPLSVWVWLRYGFLYVKPVLTMILLICFLIFTGFISPEEAEPVQFTWQLVIALLAGIYEVVVRLIPTVTNYSFIGKIIDILKWLSDFLNKKKAVK